MNELKKKILKIINDSVKKLIKKEFDTSTDPYGKKWKKKKIPNGKPTLIDTGKMRRSFRYLSTEKEIKVTNSTSYFPLHQSGTSKMPARVMVPKSKGLTQIWRKQIGTDLKKQMDKICKNYLKNNIK